jgi:hypothetical protein
MQIEMAGHIVSVNAKVDASGNLVKRITLEVQGDISSVQDFMKTPLVIGFDPQQATFGTPK